MTRSWCLPLAALLFAVSCADAPQKADAEAPAPVTVSFEEAVEDTIALDHPDWPLAARGSIWINRETGEIERIDPDRGDVVSSIETDAYPCQNGLFISRALWTIDCSTSALLRVDLSKEGVAQRIRIAGLPRQTFGSIAFAAGRIWVQASGEGGYSVVPVDPASGEVGERSFIGKEAAGIVASGDLLWISNPFEGVVYKFDATSGEVVDTVEGLEEPRWLAVYDGSVWVLNEGDGTVARINEETSEIESTIAVGDDGASGYIVAAERAIWARPAGTLYARIDPRTNAVTHEVTGDFDLGGLAVGFGSVWATGVEEGKLWRLALP